MDHPNGKPSDTNKEKHMSVRREDTSVISLVFCLLLFILVDTKYRTTALYDVSFLLSCYQFAFPHI